MPGKRATLWFATQGQEQSATDAIRVTGVLITRPPWFHHTGSHCSGNRPVRRTSVIHAACGRLASIVAAQRAVVNAARTFGRAGTRTSRESGISWVRHRLRTLHDHIVVVRINSRRYNGPRKPYWHTMRPERWRLDPAARASRRRPVRGHRRVVAGAPARAAGLLTTSITPVGHHQHLPETW
jgi:hypothetical protein